MSIQPNSTSFVIPQDANFSEGIKTEERSVWSKIKQFFTRFFDFICWRSHSSLKLTERQIQLMNAVKPNLEGRVHATELPLRLQRTDANTQPQQQEPIPSSSGPKYDDSLENMRSFALEFIKLLSKDIYEDECASAVKKIQEVASQLPEKLKAGAARIIDIGDALSDSLMDQLKAHNINDHLTPAFKQILDKLKQNSNLEQINILRNFLKDSFKTESLPKGQKIEEYIEPVIEWIFNSDYTTPLKNQFPHNKAFDDEKIRLVFVKAITFKVHHKIDSFQGRLNKLLQVTMPKVVQEILQDNALMITDHLTKRLSELISNMGDVNFKETFDNVALCAQKQAELTAGLNSIDKLSAYDAHLKTHDIMAQTDVGHPLIKKIIEFGKKAPQDAKEYNDSAERDYFLQFAGDLLDLLLPPQQIEKPANGEENTKDGFSVLWNKFSFGKELNQLIDQSKELLTATIGQNQYTKILENNIIPLVEKFVLTSAKEFTKRLIAEKMQQILEKLTQPDNLEDLFAEVLPIIEENIIEILSEQTLNANDKKVFSIFEDLIFKDRTQVYEAVGKNLYGEMSKFLEQYSKAEHVSEEDFIKNYVPNIVSNMTQTFLQKEMLNPWPEELFQSLRRGEEDSENKIYQELYKRVKTKIPSLKEGNEEDFQKFVTISKPVVKEMANTLFAAQTFFESKGLVLTLSHIQNLFEPKEIEENSIYGELVVNLLKIGGFGKKTTVVKLLQGTIGNIILKSINKFRTSHRALLNTVLNSQRKILLPKNPDEKNADSLSKLQDIKQSLLAEKQKLEENPVLNKEQIALTEQKLTEIQLKIVHEIEENKKLVREGVERVARAAFDFLHYNLKTSQGWSVGKIFQTAVGYSDFQNVIWNCYNKIIKDQILIKNLALNIQEVVFHALSESNKNLEEKKIPRTLLTVKNF